MRLRGIVRECVHEREGRLGFLDEDVNGRGWDPGEEMGHVLTVRRRNGREGIDRESLIEKGRRSRLGLDLGEWVDRSLPSDRRSRSVAAVGTAAGTGVVVGGLEEENGIVIWTGEDHKAKGRIVEAEVEEVGAVVAGGIAVVLRNLWSMHPMAFDRHTGAAGLG